MSFPRVAPDADVGGTRAPDRALLLGFAAGLWALFVVLAWLSPVLLDDWYQLAWHKTHAFGLSSIWTYAHYNYFHFNPRLGDTFLLVINGPHIVHLVLSPLVQLGLLWLGFALAFGRWPRALARDVQVLLLLQTLIWLISPIPGIIYFYRPFATNYLWAITTTLALFVPYRLALARRVTPAWPALIPCMLIAGWAAGMSNEHTGPAAIVAVLLLVAWAWRTGRLRAWMVTGCVGLLVGYPMLFFAPGQALRYAGMANRNTPLRLLAERGLDGCFEIVLDFLGEAQLATLGVGAAVLLFLATHRRRGTTPPGMPRPALLTAALLIVAAGAIVVTLFASPTVGERLFFASSVLLACALAIVLDHLLEEPRTRRVIVIVAALIFGYHAWRLVRVYTSVKAENDARIALLRHAPPGTIAKVPPYVNYKRTRWHWGDDFQYASLREYVGNEVFDVRGIELDRHVRWAQPSPPDHYVATRTFEPPLPDAQADAVAPVPYIPTYWEWTLVQLRKLMALSPLGHVPGHRLVRYTVTSVGLGLEDPQRRPIRVLDWTPTSLRFVDGRPFDDRLGAPTLRIYRESLPPAVSDVFVVGCGKTARVAFVPDPANLDPLVPLTLACRGTHTVVVCDQDVCWLAGRYWL